MGTCGRQEREYEVGGSKKMAGRPDVYKTKTPNGACSYSSRQRIRLSMRWCGSEACRPGSEYHDARTKRPTRTETAR